ncbi:hypothetical protein CU097_006262 [Rhizopus azygosporus]|uniref:Protein kinase domain-containing protein n=1 Tax=Rhizopus azygosporus TaxID=86630 RepID=A0A367JAQ9_RHIAZ|nr:hypothetical protein CU097_006262 [Rhizopus azygosporus]
MECNLIIGKERSIRTPFTCQYCAHCVPKELSTISFLSLSNIDELTDKMTEYCDSDIDERERSLFSPLSDLSQPSDSQEMNEDDDHEEEEPRRVLRPKKPIIYRTETPFKELGLFRRTCTKEKKKLPETKNNIKESSTKKNDEADIIEYPEKLIGECGRIDKSDIQVHNCLLGEGQTSLVYKGKYKNLTIACKTGRIQCLKENEKKVKRELEFSNKLYTCRFTNRYIGWIYCHPNEIMNKDTMKKYTRSKFKPSPTIFVIQRHFPNRDGRTYFHNRGTNIHPYEILQIGICLFSALENAHELGIGFVDLKLENLLQDLLIFQISSKSCIEFNGRENVHLTKDISWTYSVAAPEMIEYGIFSKASDVFMAMVIIAELTSVNKSDELFEKNVLQRQSSGHVAVVTKYIPRRYKQFYPLLRAGLKNDAALRPTAKDVLECLLNMKAE